jgi:hypothetical protein
VERCRNRILRQSLLHPTGELPDSPYHYLLDKFGMAASATPSESAFLRDMASLEDSKHLDKILANPLR